MTKISTTLFTCLELGNHYSLFSLEFKKKNILHLHEIRVGRGRGKIFLEQTTAACDAKVHFHRCIRNKLYDKWVFSCTKAVILNEELKSCAIYYSYKFKAQDNNYR